jgi:hypothetical protein
MCDYMPSTFFFMPLQVLTLLPPTQIHATLPRLILHLHDDDLSVRLACRVYTLWSTTFPLTTLLFELAYVTLCCFVKNRTHSSSLHH